jgi:hypothetical protein
MLLSQNMPLLSVIIPSYNELATVARRMGLTIAEVPICYTPRAEAEGKKIGWTDGWEALVTLWRWRNWRPAAVVHLNLEEKARCVHALS